MAGLPCGPPALPSPEGWPVRGGGSPQSPLLFLEICPHRGLFPAPGRDLSLGVWAYSPQTSSSPLPRQPPGQQYPILRCWCRRQGRGPTGCRAVGPGVGQPPALLLPHSQCQGALQKAKGREPLWAPHLQPCQHGCVCPQVSAGPPLLGWDPFCLSELTLSAALGMGAGIGASLTQALLGLRWGCFHGQDPDPPWGCWH